MSRVLEVVFTVAAVLILAVGLCAQTGETLYSFSGGLDGANPLSSLTTDASGNLYGTTQVGGAYGAGEVYELSPDGRFVQFHGRN